MATKTKVCITGSAGFIAGHLCNYMSNRGYFVRAVDYVEPRYGDVNCDEEWWGCDLRDANNTLRATDGMDWVLALASDMGGMQRIAYHNAEILHNNLLINANTIEAARLNNVKRYFFSSSACAYRVDLQDSTNPLPLKETDAWPANPQHSYGLEKLVTEKLCEYYYNDFGLETRIARFHAIYGPYGAWRGGREKAPAALSRKVAVAKLTGNPEVEIWGDGKAVRTFMYVSDCTEGIHRLMLSDYPASAVNLGATDTITVDGLVDLIADIAGVEIIKKHIPGPQGVRGRNADISLAYEVLDGWQPTVSLRDGMTKTYGWVESQVREALERGEKV